MISTTSKKICFLLLFLAVGIHSFQQTEAFDIINYRSPAGWKKESTASALQFTKQDDTKGAFCMITVMRSVPGTAKSKDNFDAAWETVVKEMVTVTVPPTMEAPSTDEGWEIQTGYAPFENDGAKGIAILITSTGQQKMLNVLILTNTDEYEKEMTAFLGSISYRKTANNNNLPVKNVTPVQSTSTPKKDGFTFNTTNFDDGWVSTVQEDWVEVKKGNLKVLIHYPKDGTIIAADPEPHTNNAWNILVAPRYSNLRNYKTTYISTYNRPYLGFGYLTDNASGKEVYVLLYRQGETGWLEFVSPDKNSFVQQYKFDPDNIRWDSETDLLKPLSVMSTYNKFAIGAADFKGSWTSDFKGVQQLYHVYTGNYAGMNIHQSSQTFQFGPGNTYKWDLMAVNGMVGNMKYASVKSSGKFTVLNNWQINFSDMEGKPKTYDAYFACIKGARLLMMNDAVSKGSGIYTAFGKK